MFLIVSADIVYLRCATSVKMVMKIAHYLRVNVSICIVHTGTFPLPIRSTRSSRSPKFCNQVRPTVIWFVHTISCRPLLDRYSTTHNHSRLLHDLNPTTTPILIRLSRSLTRSLLDRTRPILDLD